MLYLADDLEGRLADHDPDFPALERSRRLSLLETLDGTEAEAAWVGYARRELGQRDYPGPKYNHRILEYLATTGQQANDDETSWCSAFVNWCMLKAGQRGTNNALARSWLEYGERLPAPRPGCIAILWRESPSSWKGHVGFFDGTSAIACGCWPEIKEVVSIGTKFV